MRRLVVTLIAFLSIVVSEARTDGALSAVTGQVPTTPQASVAESSEVIRQLMKDGAVYSRPRPRRNRCWRGCRLQASRTPSKRRRSSVLLVESLIGRKKV